MAGEWVQPSLTSSQIFTSLHTPETTLKTTASSAKTVLLYCNVAATRSLYQWVCVVLSGSCTSPFLLTLQNAATHMMKSPTKTSQRANPAAFLSFTVPHVISELNNQYPFPLCSVLWLFILSDTWAHTSLACSFLLPHLNCNEEETPRGPHG